MQSTAHSLSDLDDVSSLTGKRILVTGSRGYLGSQLTLLLRQVDCELILFDRTAVNAAENAPSDRATVIRKAGDVSEPASFADLLGDVEVIFHLAAVDSVRVGYDPIRDLQVNSLGVLNLLEACRQQCPAAHVLFTSSTNLYGLLKELPADELAPIVPPSLWSLHKSFAEGYFRTYADLYGIASTVIRVANIYGPSASPEVSARMALNWIIQNAIRTGEIWLYPNCDCIRDYLHVDDAARAIVSLATRERSLEQISDTYIVASGDGKTFREIFELVASSIVQVVDRRVQLREKEGVEMTPLDMRNFVADIGKISAHTGWHPRIGLEFGIRSTVDHYSRFS